MKKIMFNDKFLLTQAVLEGIKTQTRRIVPQSLIDKYEDWYDDVCCIAMPSGSTIETLRGWLLRKHTRYRVGEMVAVAQSYCSIADELNDLDNATCVEHYEQNVEKASEYMLLIEHPGFYNKMFVAPDMMIHQIRITNVRVERLQDISDEDCLKEGIIKGQCGSADTHFMDAYCVPNDIQPYCTPQDAYEILIDKVSGKGTWERNPYVFVYDFELVK